MAFREHTGYRFLPPLRELRDVPDFASMFRNVAELLDAKPPVQLRPSRRRPPQAQAGVETDGAVPSPDVGVDENGLTAHERELLEVLFVWLERERTSLLKETEDRLREVYTQPAAERRVAVEMQRMKWRAFADSLRLIEDGVRDGGGVIEVPNQRDAKAMAALHFLAQWETGTTREKVRALRAVMEMYGKTPPQSDAAVGAEDCTPSDVRGELEGLRRRFADESPGDESETQLVVAMKERTKKALERDRSLLLGLLDEIGELRGTIDTGQAGSLSGEEAAQFEAQMQRVEYMLQLKEEQLKAHLRSQGWGIPQWLVDQLQDNAAREAALRAERRDLDQELAQVTTAKRDAILAKQQQGRPGAPGDREIEEMELRAGVAEEDWRRMEQDYRVSAASEYLRRAEALLAAVRNVEIAVADKTFRNQFDHEWDPEAMALRKVEEAHRAKQIQMAADAAIRRAELLEQSNAKRAEAHRNGLRTDAAEQRLFEARRLLERHARGVWSAAQDEASGRLRGGLQEQAQLAGGARLGAGTAFLQRWNAEVEQAAERTQAAEQYRRDVEAKVTAALGVQTADLKRQAAEAAQGSAARGREFVSVKLVMQGLRKSKVSDQAGFVDELQGRLQSALQLGPADVKVRLAQ